MLTLTVIILGVLVFVFYKTNKRKLYKLFLLTFVIIGVIAWASWEIYLIKLSDAPDLNECRQNREAAQGEMQQLKKELIEKDSLAEETVNQFLEDYRKSENAVESYTYLIEENKYYLEGGGKEKLEFWLFFNLF